jgi:branched-chain amino acid transport system substrate-binding protein
VRRRLGLATLVLLAACAPAVPPQASPDAPPAETPRDPGEPRPTASATIGVIVPQTGPELLRQYGELILEGVRIAVAGRPNIEVQVVDDRGDANAAAAIVADLERRGAVAVVGPLLSEGLAAAIRGRASADLLVISPTSSDRAPAGAANAYSLNTSDAEGAAALARHAVQSGAGRVAILHPAGVEQREVVTAFRDALAAAGGQVVQEVAFPPGTTTFAQQMQRLRQANPQALFVAASERDVRQLAPQIEYYGLGNVRVLGSEAWGSEEVLRGVAARVLEGVVTVTPLLRTSSAVSWGEFVGRYEAAHRRTLDNAYPGLGYDAAGLIIAALEGGSARPADVSRRVAATAGYRGATGILTVRDGAITRRPFLVRIENGRLVPLPGGG